MSFQYDDHYRLHCKLTLHSGREITLTTLNQKRTYAGLLEGTPNAKSNNLGIEWTLKEAQRLCVEGEKPYLITPPRRDDNREPGDMRRLVEANPLHIPEWLPAVECIAQFQSSTSFLVVVWYQEDFAPPIQEPALGQLLALDWDSLAIEIDSW